MYSQNNEEKVLTEYFGDFKGTLLDIGANDGKLFSNSLRLIELGWDAVLIEPSLAAFLKLEELHNSNDRVICLNIAIGNENGAAILHESGHHLPDKSDISLLSTLKPEEKKRWNGVMFREREVRVLDYATFKKRFPKDFDFINIDAEGMDWDILSQIDLSGTKCVCVEHNSVDTGKYVKYCEKYNLKLIHQNAENVICAK